MLGKLTNKAGRSPEMQKRRIQEEANTVRNGKYPLYGERGIVTLGVPKGAVKRFLSFVDSEEGQKILSRQGIVSVN